MRDTNDRRRRGQGGLQDAVQDDGGEVIESKEGVIGVDAGNAQFARVGDGFVRECARGLMRVDDLDGFPEEDVSQDGEGGRECGEGVFVDHGEDGAVVDFEGSWEVAHSGSF